MIYHTYDLQTILYFDVFTDINPSKAFALALKYTAHALDVVVSNT